VGRRFESYPPGSSGGSSGVEQPYNSTAFDYFSGLHFGHWGNSTISLDYTLGVGVIGNTTGFGPAILGSSPRCPAKRGIMEVVLRTSTIDNGDY
jgi:hypothetical protein